MARTGISRPAIITIVSSRVMASAGVLAAAESCQGRKALRVARTLEIDTTGAPRYGHQQYKDLSFLAEGEVVLTFDDGPLRPYTRPVLDALAAHCTKATFFMVGRMAIADPELVREVARRGHTIGTHTWSHQNLRTIGASNARHEIEYGISTVQRAAGAPIAPFFRFPYLSDPAHAQAQLQSRSIAIFSIDVDAVDAVDEQHGRAMRDQPLDGVSANGDRRALPVRDERRLAQVTDHRGQPGAFSHAGPPPLHEGGRRGRRSVRRFAHGEPAATCEPACCAGSLQGRLPRTSHPDAAPRSFRWRRASEPAA